MATKRVRLLNTGGTIGMCPGERGYRPDPGGLAVQLAAMPELSRPNMPHFELHELDPLLDSANMSPLDWVTIASAIADRYDDFDAFVVLHGTDTMAYTAAALSFMLGNLGKTVILTGSQIPLRETRNDARHNLVTSLLFAAGDPIPEVTVFFEQKLMRGNRARKLHASRLDAFDSPNYPLLGRSGVELEVFHHRLRPAPSQPFQLRHIANPRVAQIRLFPGISAEIVRNFVQPPLEGLVIETYGVGNAPARDAALLEVLAAAADRGVVIVATTQCESGRVDLSDYATGAALARAGVVGGADMTPEAALTKLFFLLSLGLPPEAVRQRVGEDLSGELTGD
jgi:L-asparaginase